MRTLETQLGAPLLTRSSRGVTPTAGRGGAAARGARAALPRRPRRRRGPARDPGRHRRAAGRLPHHRRPRPDAARSSAPSPSITPRSRCETDDLAIGALVAGVRDGRLDAGLSRPPLVDDVVAEPVSDEPVAAVLPAGHRAERPRRAHARRSRGRAVGAHPAQLVAAVAPQVRRRLRRGRLPAARGAARHDPAGAARARRGRRRRHPPAAVLAQPAGRRRHLRAARRRARAGRPPHPPGRRQPGTAGAARDAQRNRWGRCPRTHATARENSSEIRCPSGGFGGPAPTGSSRVSVDSDGTGGSPAVVLV